MNLFIYAVLGLIATWTVYLLYVHVATRAAEGRSAEPLFAALPALRGADGKVLVYCFSPQCGPCRPMSREVDTLQERGAPVFKLDVTQHPQIAVDLGIRATPTLILVHNGTIARMVLGVRTASYMSQLIDPATS